MVNLHSKPFRSTELKLGAKPFFVEEDAEIPKKTLTDRAVSHAALSVVFRDRPSYFKQSLAPRHV